MGLGILDDVLAFTCAYKLTFNVYALTVKVNVRNSQPAELRYTQPCVKQDKYPVIILAVVLVISDEIKVILLLVFIVTQ